MIPMDSTPLEGRLSYTLVCLICLALVSTCLALRTQHLRVEAIATLPAIRLYLIAVYFWGLCFIIAVATLRFGYQVRSKQACLASILLCLVFYVVDKVIMYLFLVERIHVVRSRRFTRLTDYWYIVNIFIVILGFGTIAVLSFIFPVAEFNEDKCRIGLPFKITLPLLIFDISINLYLTSHFLYLVRPSTIEETVRKVRVFLAQNTNRPSDSNPSESRAANCRNDNLRKLAKRTLNGMCIMLLATTVNLAILFFMSGREEEWMCFMFCTLDVTVGILALHYVTNHPSEEHLGVKEPLYGRRHDATAGFESSVMSDRTGRARVWAGQDHSDEDVIASPDRIFVSTSYELYRIDEQISEDVNSEKHPIKI